MVVADGGILLLDLSYSPSNQVVIGQTITPIVTAFDSARHELTPPAGQLQFTSFDTAIASVDLSTGVVTGNDPGTATIEVNDVTTGAITFATVTVTPIPVTHINLSPTSGAVSYLQGTTLQLTATPQDAADNVLTLPAGALIWSSSNPNIATVSSTGLVSAGTSGGSATITVTYGANDVAGAVTVSADGDISTLNLSYSPSSQVAAGQTITPVVTAFDAAGNKLTLPVGTQFQFSGLSNGIASVVSSTGVVTGLNAGTATIEAIDVATGANGLATVTVSGTTPTPTPTPLPVNHIDLSPAGERSVICRARRFN